MRKAKPKNYQAEQSRLVMRMVSVDAGAVDAEAKSVPVIIATETPVEMIDEKTGMLYHEILNMDGAIIRGGRDRLPIVDSHDRDTVRNVLGSIRDIHKYDDPILGPVLRGYAVFARNEDSQDAFEKLLDGHLDDFSISAIRQSQRRIPTGERFIHRDKDLVGPAVIVDEWTATDASLVAAGADSNAMVLRSKHYFMEIQRMLSEEQTTLLTGLGMPEQITDAEQAIAWMAAVMQSTTAPTEPVEMAEEEKPEDEVERMEEEKEEEKDDESVERKIQRALADEKKRRREIEALCKKANVERAIRDKLLDSDCSLETAREKVLTTMIERQEVSGSNVRIEARESSSDKTRDAIRDGLVLRSVRSGSIKQPSDFQPAPGAADFASMSLIRIAERHLRDQGFNVDRMNGPDIARAAMGNRSVIEHYRSMGVVRDAYHTTGSFPALMLNAANKTLLAGYTEATATWKAWARQGASTSDLKPINRIRYSESGNPEMVPERAKYPERPMSDEKETYSPEKHGNMFSVSWETIVNDDLDAISRTPQMHGNACARLVNRSVYQVLIKNPLMGDGQALFSASHASGSNYVASGSGAAPSVGTLNTAFEAMMLQKGLNTDAILALEPRFLIVPAKLSGTALELVNSISYNASNNNSGVQNIYGVGGPRQLQVIVEPQLDLGVNTQWFLAADPSQVDTVEVTFLQGEETPQLDQEWDFERDIYKYKVRQTFGVAPIDWRGLFSNYGA
jgi:hypothetical protein